MEEFIPITAWIFLVTLALPPVNAFIKRLTSYWSKESQTVLIFLVCAFAGLGQAFFNGSLKYSNGDWQAYLGILVVNVAVVVDFAYLWYKMIYQDSGIDARISGK